MGEQLEKGGKRVVGHTRWHTEGGERGTVASSLLRSVPLRLLSSLPVTNPDTFLSYVSSFLFIPSHSITCRLHDSYYLRTADWTMTCLLTDRSI